MTEAMTDEIVRASGVRKLYHGGTVVALDGVSLQIGRGEFVAVTGPSGSGKTSLLNCLSGLDRIDAGEIRLNGQPLHTMGDDQRTRFRAEQMGFVFQSFNLLPVLTAAENVELPLLLLGNGSRAARSQAVALLEELGLGDRAGHFPSELSGGQQQRVALARAVVHEPAIVWADEPTGNLDSAAAQSVLRLLTERNAAGQTIVLVTHDPAAAALAGRRIAMLDGRIHQAELAAAGGVRP